MPRDTPAPLFHPFETGDLDWPGDASRVLYLGALPTLRPPTEFSAALTMVQGFRPDFLALQRAGYSVLPELERLNEFTPTPDPTPSPAPLGGGVRGGGQPSQRSDVYDLALILATKHRGENEMMLAEAVSRVKPGGPVVVAGGKTDGIASLRKRLYRMLPLGGHLAKNHGEVFWFSCGAEAKNAAASVTAEQNAASLIEGRFHTAPGMFSHDRVDAGSNLLAAHLPANLKGKAADFCAGWGYLSVVLAEQAQGITSIKLFEADHASLEAARANMTALAPNMSAGFHWLDLAAEKLTREFDVIVMNPPFHQGRAADPGIGHAMIRAASGALKPGGQLFMVANRGLPYEPALKAGFARVAELADENGFRVWQARR